MNAKQALELSIKSCDAEIKVIDNTIILACSEGRTQILTSHPLKEGTICNYINLGFDVVTEEVIINSEKKIVLITIKWGN